MKQQEMFPETVPETYLEGVQIILARMDTHPDEFSTKSGKWGDILSSIFDSDHEYGMVLTGDEVLAVKEKFTKIMRERLTADVLRALTSDKELTKNEAMLKQLKALYDKQCKQYKQIKRNTPV